MRHVSATAMNMSIPATSSIRIFGMQASFVLSAMVLCTHRRTDRMGIAMLLLVLVTLCFSLSVIGISVHGMHTRRSPMRLCLRL